MEPRRNKRKDDVRADGEETKGQKPGKEEAWLGASSRIQGSIEHHRDDDRNRRETETNRNEKKGCDEVEHDGVGLQTELSLVRKDWGKTPLGASDYKHIPKLTHTTRNQLEQHEIHCLLAISGSPKTERYTCTIGAS
jgi:hypothetical protein